MKEPRVQVVVVRDGELEALRNPPPKTFTRFSDVDYFHVSEARPLPAGSHYFFNCVRVDERLYALGELALHAGASLTFIVRHVDAALARFAEERNINLVPAYGCADQITPATMFRAVRNVLAGRRVVATGFIHNSINRPGSHASGRSNTVISLLTEASRLANASTTVAAGVLSLHRTGSNFLRDLIGMTLGGRVGIYHEHDVPAASAVQPDPSRPLFDQEFLERDAARARSLRRAILRNGLLDARRRFIFLCEREPDDRLTSYFQKRHMALLLSSYDPERQVLRNTADIQRMFELWLKKYVRMQRKWYKDRLVKNFGLNLLESTRTDDGFLLGHHATNTLLVVPTARLSALRDDLAATFGTDAYDVVASNSIKVRGGRDIDRAFRRQIRFDPAAAESLWEIPEVAYIHRHSEQSMVRAL